MESFHRPTRVEISLDALEHNMTQFQQMLPTNLQMMAVVKANGYGHGAVQIAREALSRGIQYLGVNFLDEALELRLAGISGPVLVLGYTPPDAIFEAWKHDVTIAVFSDELLDAIRVVGTAERPLKVHVKVDTGMSRLGIPDHDDAVDFTKKLSEMSNVFVEGLFTHFAVADELDKSFTRIQYEKFQRLVAAIAEQGVYIPLRHAGNSAAAIDSPEWSGNMVRVGVSLYGLYPSNEVQTQRIALRPLMQFKTGIVLLKTVNAGTPVSYGCTFVTHKVTRVATIPVGYGDGFTRMLTGKAEVLVRGKRVPIIGRICMDQCMVDVTDVPNVRVGDEVVLFGEQNFDGLEDRITVEELATKLGTINYEITCMVSHRVPRVFLREGVREDVVNLLFHTEGKPLADHVT